MRLIRLAPAIAPLLLIAATCVANVEQKGDTGPWVGEVHNTGDQGTHGVSAVARVTDARGREYYPGTLGVLACPSKLLPGERGAFELFLPTENQNPDYELRNPELPLTASFEPLAHENVGTGQARGDGLFIEELSRDADANSALIRVTNNGPGAYSEWSVCGIVRSESGKVEEVGRADGPRLPAQLAPGASIELTMRFNTLPDGRINYHALGLLDAPYVDCCPLGASTWRPVHLGSFSVLLPPDWRYEQMQGIDSFVGKFVGPNAELTFDFGWYSYPLPFDNDPAHRVHMETIGGFAAKVVMPSGAGTTGVHIDDIDKPIDGSHFITTALSVFGENLSAADKEIALQIFRSIRICECFISGGAP